MKSDIDGEGESLVVTVKLITDSNVVLCMMMGEEKRFHL